MSGITVTWGDDSESYIFIAYSIPWTAHDFDVALYALAAAMDSVNHRVDIVFDVRNAGFPKSNMFSRFKRAAEMNHPNTGKLIFIGPKAIIRFIETVNRVLSQLYGSSYLPPRFIFVSSFEEMKTHLTKKV